MFKKYVPVIVAAMLLPGLALASEPVVLDLTSCISLALDQHPSLKIAGAELEAARARLAQAKAGYQPSLDWNTSLSHGDPTPGASYDKLSNGLSLSQTITDFGRTRGTVAVSRMNAQASQADLNEQRLNLIYAVKEAYWGLLKAQQDQAAYAAEVERLEQHLAQARAFYTVGTKPKIEVTKAEVELNQARLNRLKAGGSLRLARVKLSNAIGLSQAGSFAAHASAWLPAGQPDMDSSLEKAYATRADLMALNTRRAAAERQVEVKIREYYPSLKATAGYDWLGKDNSLDREWRAGLNLNFAFYDGTTKGAIREARADLDKIQAEVELKRQTIRLEVETALIGLSESQAQVRLAELSLRQARENRELAQGRYSSGVGSAVEVTDALTSELETQRDLTAAQHDCRLAQASLDKATGVEQ